MFHKLHYYDDFYLDDDFWNCVEGRCRMRRNGFSKAIGEMDLYGPWWSDRNVFLHNYEWCRSHRIVKSFCWHEPNKACLLENVYVRWNAKISFCEHDRRCFVVENDNPFDRFAVRVNCFVDDEKNHYARYFFDEIDDSCDGFAIEVAVLFGFKMDMEQIGSKTVYSFRRER